MFISRLFEFCRSKLRPAGHSPDASDSSLNEERPFWEATKFIQTLATALGLHIITRTGPKGYVVSFWKLLPTCVYMLSNVYTFGVIGYIVYMNVLSTYQLVLMFPTFCNCGSCCYSFILILKRSGQMAKYLTVIDEEGATIRMTTYTPLWFLPMLIYSTVFTAALVISDKIIPSDYSYVMLYPTFIGTFLPGFLDIYIFSFIRMIISSLEKLGRSVRNTEHWTEATITSVAKKWIRIHGFLDTSNKIFSYVLHVRLVMFIVKGMLFMYSLSLLKEDIGDSYLVSVTISGVNEVTLRIFLICQLGNNVLRANEDIIYAVRAAVLNHGAGTDTEKLRAKSDATEPKKQHAMTEASNADKKSPEVHSVPTADCALGLSTGKMSDSDGQSIELQSTSLQNLLSRLEAQPMAVEIWGFECLSSATFSNHVSRILTYLVVLLQLNQG